MPDHNPIELNLKDEGRAELRFTNIYSHHSQFVKTIASGYQKHYKFFKDIPFHSRKLKLFM